MRKEKSTMTMYSIKVAKNSIRKLKSIFKCFLMSYPKKIQCNICGWSGRKFLSDLWHKHVICPKCHSGIRQRLFDAALQNIDDLSFEKLIFNKRVLHFAPEEIISVIIQNETAYYATADFLRSDCDLKINMSSMPEVKNNSFDTIIAFDVLEHVPDYQKALQELYRILALKGSVILTVPQKDNLLVTYENPDMVTTEERLKHFGQKDHLRIFGQDILEHIENKGFKVTTVSESSFSQEIIKRHILFPPLLSKYPLATNYRKVYFCQKV